MLLKSFTSLALLIISTQAYTAGTSAVMNGNELTISGSGFGSQNPMLFWDDAQQLFEETGASSGDDVPFGAGEKWEAVPNQWATPFFFQEGTDTKGSKINAYYKGLGKKVYLGKPKMAETGDTHKMYVSWWYRPSMSPASEGGSNKFIRIWDDPDGNGTRISWTQMHLTCGSSTTWGNWNGIINAWNHHEIYVDLNNSTVKTWVNGNLVHQTTNCIKSSTYSNLGLYIGLIGFDHGMESYANMNTSLDDIYIGKSLQRVELTQNPTWNATDEREVLPITSWADNEIRAKTFKTSANRVSKESYIYIFDSNGLHNNEGIPLTCDSCPSL